MVSTDSGSAARAPRRSVRTARLRLGPPPHESLTKITPFDPKWSKKPQSCLQRDLLHEAGCSKRMRKSNIFHIFASCAFHLLFGLLGHLLALIWKPEGALWNALRRHRALRGLCWDHLLGTTWITSEAPGPPELPTGLLFALCGLSLASGESHNVPF